MLKGCFVAKVTIAELAGILDAEYAGRGDLEIVAATKPAQAGVNDLALAMDASYGSSLARSKARAAVLWEGADWQGMGLLSAIFVTRPRLAMSGITGVFAPTPEIQMGIHPSAVVDPTAEIGENVAIGPLTSIGPRARIGENSRIMGQVTICEDVTIGTDALIHSGCRIGSGVVIGDRFIAHFNAVIGSDGFSFVTPEPGTAEEARLHFETSGGSPRQAYRRIASTASVRIGDDVEVGANATIDKGTVADTVVGRGTKMDDQTHIGHNARVGEDCLMCGHSGVSGSVVLGDGVVMGGQSGVSDHVIVGDDVIVAGATAILSNVPKGRVMMGYPAMQMKQNIEAYKALRRLPRLMKKIDELAKQVLPPSRKT